MINLDLTLRNQPDEKRLLKAKEMVQFARDIIEKLLLFSRQASHLDQREPWILSQVVEDGLTLFSQSLGHLKSTSAPAKFSRPFPRSDGRN